MSTSDAAEQEVIRSLKPLYRSSTQTLARDFFAPCLRATTRYDRAAGYFSSTALITWSEALLRMVADELRVRLLISPELSSEDARAFASTTDESVKRDLLCMTADKLVGDALQLGLPESSADIRLRLLMWMIASQRLEVRFAIPKHVDDAGIFHEKSGLFHFPWGDVVAFSGSPNETGAGHVRNYEKLDVFRSWVASDSERVEAARVDFERQWDGNDSSLLVIPLSKHALDLIKERAPTERPGMKAPAGKKEDLRWRHQAEAAEAFLRTGHGVLEMATGTGKTSTALLIAARLLSEGKTDGIVIATDGNDLLDQWGRTLFDWAPLTSRRMRLFRQYGSFHQGAAFALAPGNAVLLVSRPQLSEVLATLKPSDAARLLVIHDEVHGLGTPSSLEKLTGKHAQFGFTLGLSATPEREYDAAGSAFIEREIGPVVYRFGLRDAIERGILVEFDYVPLKYELTEADRRRLATVYAKRSARAAEGRPMSQEEVWTELSRVYKTAEEKPLVFESFIRENRSLLKRSIIFIEERDYGVPILETISKYTHLYRTYYADDDRDHLVAFARGETDCLITCHRISQGIDIRDLRTVFLFSSARAKLETIQRIGRCLRRDPADPHKRAVVVDFVRDTETGGGDGEDFVSADVEREAWLRELSSVRTKE